MEFCLLQKELVERYLSKRYNSLTPAYNRKIGGGTSAILASIAIVA